MENNLDNKDRESVFVRNELDSVKSYDQLDQLVKDYNEKYYIKPIVLGMKNQVKTIMKYNMEFDKKENENMREIKTKGIVDLYFRNIKTRMVEYSNKRTKDIVESDKNSMELMTKINEANSLIDQFNREGNVCYPSIYIVKSEYITADSDDLIAKLDDELLNDIEKLKKNKAEVVTMLSACYTYDQEMEVLKNYGIIGEDGKLSNNQN